MSTRTITIHDKCTVDGCGKTLHSIKEGERGTCSSCWFKAMPASTKNSLNRLIASAFNGSSEAEKDAAVKDAINALKKEREEDAHTKIEEARQ